MTFLRFLILILLFSRSSFAAQVLTNEIKEGSSSFLTVTFKDQNGNAVRPNTIEFSTVEKSTGTVLIPLQSVPTPAAVPSPTNAGRYDQITIINQSSCGARMIGTKTTQTNVISMKYTYGSSVVWPSPGQYTGTDSAEYTVSNIPGYVVIPSTPTAGTPNCILVTPTPTPTS